MHGSIGPSCAVGLFPDGVMTVWTHSQGVIRCAAPSRRCCGSTTERVRCIHIEGSGCYGHNGADDAGADAALIARAFPAARCGSSGCARTSMLGALRLRHGVDGAGAARCATAKSSDWQYEVWSNPHHTPGPAGQPDAGVAPRRRRSSRRRRSRSRSRRAAATATPSRSTVSQRARRPSLHSGHAAAGFRVAGARRLHERLRDRELHGRAGEAAGADPVEFRLRHLEDARARDVIDAAAERFGWARYRRRDRARPRLRFRAATRIWRPSSPSRARSRSSAKVAAPAGACRRRHRQRRGGQSRTASATRPRAASSRRRAGR